MFIVEIERIIKNLPFFELCFINRVNEPFLKASCEMVLSAKFKETFRFRSQGFFP